VKRALLTALALAMLVAAGLWYRHSALRAQEQRAGAAREREHQEAVRRELAAAASEPPPQPPGALPSATPEERDRMQRRLQAHKEYLLLERAIAAAKSDDERDRRRRDLDQVRARNREEERLGNELWNSSGERRREIQARLDAIRRERAESIERLKPAKERDCRCAADDPLCSCL
jgi:hypothetical protein